MSIFLVFPDHSLVMATRPARKRYSQHNTAVDEVEDDEGADEDEDEVEVVDDSRSPFLSSSLAVPNWPQMYLCRGGHSIWMVT